MFIGSVCVLLLFAFTYRKLTDNKIKVYCIYIVYYVIYVDKSAIHVFYIW